MIGSDLLLDGGCLVIGDGDLEFQCCKVVLIKMFDEDVDLEVVFWQGDWFLNQFQDVYCCWIIVV